MLTRSDLHAYQQDIVDYIQANERCGVWALMGTGKTVSTLTALDELSLVEDGIWPVLVLAPLRVAKSVWPNEVHDWRHLSHLRVSAVCGDAIDRKRALAADAQVFTCNYENLEWLVAHFGDAWPFRTVVCDECFVAGTPVRTPTGDVPIETVKVGDLVETHVGPRRVSRVYTRLKSISDMVTLTLSTGETLEGSSDHPFFTDAGWLPAALCEGRQVFRNSDLSDLSDALRAIRFKGAGENTREQDPILLRTVQEQSSLGETRTARNSSAKHDQAQPWASGLMELWDTMVRSPSGENVRDKKGSPISCGARGQWEGSESYGSDAHTLNARRLQLELHRTVGSLWARMSVALQAGLWQSEDEGLSGSRRDWAQRNKETRSGSPEDGSVRVVGVESFSDNQRQGVVPVFNIEVAGAPTYFANGVLVHNCSKLKSFRLRQGSKRARALASVAFSKVTRFIGLTGTPSPNGLIDLWGQTWFLDKGERLGTTFSKFEQRWFRKGYDGFSLKPMPHAEREIHDKLRDICLTVEGLQVDEPIFNNIMVDLPPAARTQYNLMEREMFAEIEGVGIEAFNAAARTSKLLQFSAGAVITDSDTGEWSPVHDVKLDALESVIEEAAGAPVLVAYHFRSDLARLKKRFPKAVALDSDPKTIDRWNAGEIPILLAHPASAGHGINLARGGNILVFFTVDWSLETYMQVIERLGPMRQKQAGLNRPVFVHHILSRKTVDEMVLERLRSKRSVQDVLLEALKRREGDAR